MGRVNLSGGFTIMSEGEYVLKIIEVKHNPDFGKIDITMTNAQGRHHFEHFSLFDKDGNSRESASNAFSILARRALRNPAAEDIDTDELIGTYLKGVISHREYEDKDGNTKKTTQREPGTYWEEVSDDEIAEFERVYQGKTSSPAAPKTTSKKYGMDLTNLLGR